METPPTRVPVTILGPQVQGPARWAQSRSCPFDSEILKEKLRAELG